MKLIDVVPGTGTWPEGARPAHHRGRTDLVGPGPGRRTFLGGMLAAATGTGLAALGVFPSARPALAAGPGGQYGYRVHTGECPSYSDGANCEPGCGPSPVYLDTCEPAGYYRGWFKNRPSEGYRLRPGQCLSGFDAWTWRYSGQCSACRQVIEYRCHDGYKSAGGAWFNAICRHVTECDGRDPDLPTTHKPLGQVSLFQRVAPDHIRLRGWAVDADATRQPVPIRVRLDGRIVAHQPADRFSNDLPTLFWQFGRHHGFDLHLKHLPAGRHVLKVHAVSIGRGASVQLLRRAIVVP
jgi:hypothetical protein